MTSGFDIFTAPAYGAGFDITGAIGKEYVFYHRYGKLFVRQYVVPANPQTPLQQAWRAVFTTGVESWQAMNKEQREPWNDDASGRPLTGFNLFMRHYLDANANG